MSPIKNNKNRWFFSKNKHLIFYPEFYFFEAPSNNIKNFDLFFKKMQLFKNTK